MTRRVVVSLKFAIFARKSRRACRTIWDLFKKGPIVVKIISNVKKIISNVKKIISNVI